MVVTLSFTSISFGRFTLQQISSNFTINGATNPLYYQTYIASGSGYSPKGWNPNYYLYFFPTLSLKPSDGSFRWAGNLYYFAIYKMVGNLFFYSQYLLFAFTSQALTLTEISRNFAAKLPNSLPVVRNLTVCN
jgi:hypothetical protein